MQSLSKCSAPRFLPRVPYLVQNFHSQLSSSLCWRTLSRFLRRTEDLIGFAIFVTCVPHGTISPASVKAMFEQPNASIILRPSSLTNVASEWPFVEILNILWSAHCVRRMTIPLFRNVYLTSPHAEQELSCVTPLASCPNPQLQKFDPKIAMD